MYDMIAFDADDTLWHNLSLFTVTQERFAEMLAPYQDAATVDQKLLEREKHNLQLFGYGVKGFTLSMIETALELSDYQMDGRTIQKLIDAGKEMLAAPVETMPGVTEVLQGLHGRIPLMVITKGDLFDQESKLARSGLAELFDIVEILSEKEPDAYRDIFKRHKLNPDRFLMIGNSLKSDILPVVAAGGHAVHIPYHTTWEHEQVTDEDKDGIHYHHMADISLLPSWLESQGC